MPSQGIDGEPLLIPCKSLMDLMHNRKVEYVLNKYANAPLLQVPQVLYKCDFDPTLIISSIPSHDTLSYSQPDPLSVII